MLANYAIQAEEFKGVCEYYQEYCCGQNHECECDDESFIADLKAMQADYRFLPQIGELMSILKQKGIPYLVKYSV